MDVAVSRRHRHGGGEYELAKQRGKYKRHESTGKGRRKEEEEEDDGQRAGGGEQAVFFAGERAYRGNRHFVKPRPELRVFKGSSGVRSGGSF